MWPWGEKFVKMKMCLFLKFINEFESELFCLRGSMFLTYRPRIGHQKTVFCSLRSVSWLMSCAIICVYNETLADRLNVNQSKVPRQLEEVIYQYTRCHKSGSWIYRWESYTPCLLPRRGKWMASSKRTNWHPYWTLSNILVQFDRCAE